MLTRLICLLFIVVVTALGVYKVYEVQEEIIARGMWADQIAARMEGGRP